MRYVLSFAILAVVIGSLHATQLSVLVYQGKVADRGEGGPGFNCYYLGTYGPFRVSHFYSADAEAQRTHWPPPREDCAWVCRAEWHRHPPPIGGGPYALCALDREAPEHLR